MTDWILAVSPIVSLRLRNFNNTERTVENKYYDFQSETPSHIHTLKIYCPPY